jgi:signal transduction histidine kinase
MKIVHKIIVANVCCILLIALTGTFAYRNLEQVLAKLRFMEIADDLNASFLEIRLSEKNYFLYHDKASLGEIRQKVADSVQAMDDARENIVRATGAEIFNRLEKSLKGYLEDVEEAVASDHSEAMQTRIREAGQRLREFSSTITRLEREKVNRIISDSRKGLFTSLALFLVAAIGVSTLVSRRILGSLRDVEKVTHRISEGDFRKLPVDDIPNDELGAVIKAIASMTEELRNREDLMIQSKKLASIGILTAGVAHELGNPLNNISMIAQTYAELYDDLGKEERLDFMQKVEEETERIREIVKNLLDFSRPKQLHLKEADINAVVRKSLKLVQNNICICNMEVDLALEDGPLLVCIDEYQIEEVMVNLVTNALHASSAGDRLHIATRFVEETANVEIEVRDTGKGILPEYLPHVFDPFFSTKGTGGTGLGLFVSYGIIKNHHGDIRVDSEVGTGTCFTISLPACGAKRKEES